MRQVSDNNMKKLLVSTIMGGALFLSSLCCFAQEPLVLATGEGTEWSAGSVDKEHLRDGKTSRLWQHGKDAAISVKVPRDWSAYNTLTFWLYSLQNSGAKFMMIIPSENNKTDGMDYYSAPITLDFTGWKRFRFSLPSLGASRDPLGWKQVDGLQFTATGWDNEPNPQAQVSIGPLVLSNEEKPKGPLMSDEELFEALNLNLPGLQTVAKAYKAGDMATAKHALAEYFRNRSNVKWYFPAGEMANPKPQNPNLTDAERALKHEMRSIGINYQFGPTIDWTFDVTRAAGSTYAPNNEWTWQLNRHSEWVALARAYRDTGDEKYAREWAAQMTQWVRDNPVPESAGNGARSAWRTIETGIRGAGPWPELWFRFLKSPSFSDEAILTMVKSFYEHAEHILPHRSTGNWLTMEANGMYHVGVLFPEFKRAATWREEAMKSLYAELDNQVYPDGVQIELASGYHHVSLLNFLGAFRVAKLNNVAVPDDYLKHLQKMYEFDVYGASPDRRLPAVQDSGAYDIRGAMREAAELFPDNAQYKWFGSDGKEGAMPPHTSHAFPWAGYFMMRSGWQSDANFLMFDGGPFGYGHQHEDKLNLIVSAYGKTLLVDPGQYQYETSKWREYFIDSPSHNVTLVDGLPQRRRGAPREQYIVKEPLPHVWISTPEYDYAQATFDEGYAAPVGKNVMHTRRVLFVKPDFWIVCDTLSSKDGKPHRYETLFHLDAPVQSDETARRVTTTSKDTPNLTIAARPDAALKLQIIEGQQQPVQGWLPNSDISSVHPAPVAVFSSEGKGETHQIYVLSPAKTGQENALLKIEMVPDNPLAARIFWRDGRVQNVVFTDGAAGKNHALLSEILPDGKTGKTIIVP